LICQFICSQFGVYNAVSVAAVQGFVVAGTYMNDYGSLKVLYYQKLAKFAVLAVAVLGTYLDGNGSHKVLYYLP
jgi:hypothetical protein